MKIKKISGVTGKYIGIFGRRAKYHTRVVLEVSDGKYIDGNITNAVREANNLDNKDSLNKQFTFDLIEVYDPAEEYRVNYLKKCPIPNITNNRIIGRSSTKIERVEKPEEQTLKNKKDAAQIETGLDGLKQAEKEQIIKVRIGQSDFRKRVLELYKRKCVVTNIEERTDSPGILIASHIKAWSKCVNANEKLDEHNALLLSPHIDTLFDHHLISFNDDGTIIAKPEIRNILKKWGVTDGRIKTAFSTETKRYLAFHRDIYSEINK